MGLRFGQGSVLSEFNWNYTAKIEGNTFLKNPSKAREI